VPNQRLRLAKAKAGAKYLGEERMSLRESIVKKVRFKKEWNQTDLGHLPLKS
jgi:hypothetical protein